MGLWSGPQGSAGSSLDLGNGVGWNLWILGGLCLVSV